MASTRRSDGIAPLVVMVVALLLLFAALLLFGDAQPT
jgi:hypothetical protein